MPPFWCTYGNSKPLSWAQEQDIRLVQLHLHLDTWVSGGTVTFLSTWIELIYVKAIIFKFCYDNSPTRYMLYMSHHHRLINKELKTKRGKTKRMMNMRTLDQIEEHGGETKAHTSQGHTKECKIN